VSYGCVCSPKKSPALSSSGGVHSGGERPGRDKDEARSIGFHVDMDHGFARVVLLEMSGSSSYASTISTMKWSSRWLQSSNWGGGGIWENEDEDVFPNDEELEALLLPYEWIPFQEFLSAKAGGGRKTEEPVTGKRDVSPYL
jgi:hypothetical protein